MTLAFLIALSVIQTPPPLVSLGNRFGLKIEVPKETFVQKAAGYTIGGTGTTEADLEKYAAYFTIEWNRYPSSVIAKSKVTKIVFCNGLKVGEQLRAAVPAFDLNTMFYDPAMGNRNPHYQRAVVHHEFFHMLDQRMGKMRVDPEWSALNPPSFHYGTGGENMRNGGAGSLVTSLPGFLTPYSTAGVEEDKAEIFSHLIIHPTFVYGQARKDFVLAQKISLLKRRLKEFDEGFSESFWPKPLINP